MTGHIRRTTNCDNATESIGSQLFEVCKRSPADLSKIKSIVESFPERVSKFRDSDGRTALHVLCANRPPLQSVVFLAPDLNSCRQRTSKGMLPLHYACREQASEDVVDFLLKQYPESVQIPTASGWFPLHLASARGSSLGVIQRLISAWPESVQQATRDGRMALHFACANHASLQIVQLLIRQNPNSIQVQDQNELTPLHIACAYSDNLDIIKYLVDEWKDGLVCPGKLGRLPLHLACWEGQTLQNVKFLVHACPQAIMTRDNDGLLPLHCACKGDAGMAVIQHLIVQAPISALELGRTVEEIAIYVSNKGVMQNAPPPPVAWCEWIKQNVSAVTDKSEQITALPLPVKDTNEQDPKEAIIKKGTTDASTPIVPPDTSLPDKEMAGLELPVTEVKAEEDQKQTHLIIEPDQMQRRPRRGNKLHGNTPMNGHQPKNPPEVVLAGKKLHEACEIPQSFDEIFQILSDKPAAIYVCTYNNMLPIHTASLNKASAEILEFLLNRSPESVHRQDGEGNLPIHLACYSGAPFESIKILVNEWPDSLTMKNNEGLTPIDKAKQPFLVQPDHRVVSFLESEFLQNSHAQQDHSIIPPCPRSASLISDTITLPLMAPQKMTAYGNNLSGPPPTRRKSAFDSMELDELSNKLNALRTAEMRQAAPKMQGTERGTTNKAPTISHPLAATQTFTTPTEWTRNADKMLHAQVSHNPMYRPGNPPLVASSPTTSPMRGGRSKRNTSPPPNKRAPSPSAANRRFPSPARIFGGRSSRNSSPSPVMKIAGFFRRKGNGSRNTSPTRIHGNVVLDDAAVVNVADIYGYNNIPVKRRSSNDFSIPTDLAINSLRSSLNTVNSGGHDMISLPPRPSSITSMPIAYKGVHEHSLLIRESPSQNVSSRTDAALASCNDSINSNEYDQAIDQLHGRWSQPSASGRVPVAPRPGPMNPTNMARTFERPMVVGAGELVDRAVRPGAMAVNEPVLRPDSEIYRAVQTTRAISPIPFSIQNQPTQFGGGGPVRPANRQGNPPLSSARPMMGGTTGNVMEQYPQVGRMTAPVVIAVPDTTAKYMGVSGGSPYMPTQEISNRIAGDTTNVFGSTSSSLPPTHTATERHRVPIRHHEPTATLTAPYAALRQAERNSQQSKHVDEALMMEIVRMQEKALMGRFDASKYSDEFASGNDPRTAVPSSGTFYRASMDETTSNKNDPVLTAHQTNLNPLTISNETIPTPTPGLTKMSSFYLSALASGRERSCEFPQGIPEDEIPPTVLSRMTDHMGVQPVTDATTGTGRDRRNATSSFYLAALEADALDISSAAIGDIPTGTTTATATATTLLPASSFYLDALHALKNNMTLPRSEEPLVTPEEDSNRASRRPAASSFYRVAMMEAQQAEDGSTVDDLDWKIVADDDTENKNKMSFG